jgi:hypothetical protein
MSAFDIHEWIHDTTRLTVADVAMVQVDAAKRHVFVKLREFNKMQILTSNQGSGEVRHMNGEISTVNIEALLPVLNVIYCAAGAQNRGKPLCKISEYTVIHTGMYIMTIVAHIGGPIFP